MAKRKLLTVGEKAEIIRKLQSGEKNITVSKLFGLSSSTVSTLWKNKDSILEAFHNNKITNKRLKRCEYPDLDEALLKWFISRKDTGLPTDGKIVKAEAMKLGKKFGHENFVCSNGWIDRFKNRHNIKYAEKRKKCKERSKSSLDNKESLNNFAPEKKMQKKTDNGDTNDDDNRDEDIHSEEVKTTEWLEKMWLDYRKEYSDNDIYSAEEIGLFFNVTPDQMHIFKDEMCTKGEMLENRLTVLLCTNMSGTDKRKLKVIGSQTKPNSLQHVRQLPVDYTSNSKAWMTLDIFTKFVQNWDSEMESENRRILLLINNSPAHTKIPNLSNIELIFLPPNATPALQPMYQGIIRSFKFNYRKELIYLLDKRWVKRQDKKISTLDALRMMCDAWFSITNEYIRDCFVRAMLLNAEDSEEENLHSLLEWLNQQNIDAFKDIKDIDDFIRIDDQLQSSGISSDEDTKADLEDVIEEIVNDGKLPTLEVALESIDNLQTFFEAASTVSDDVFKAIGLIKNELRKHKG